MSEFVIDDRSAPKFRVNRKTMIDPGIFDAEMSRIFDSSWLYVGHESEIPHRHDYRSRTVGRRPIIFSRGDDGEVRVFINSCTHRGAELCREKAGNGRFLKCFYHAWSFDLTGSLVSMPDEESYGPNFDKANLGLATPAQVDSYRGFVFVAFDPTLPDLRTYLGATCEYIDLVCDQSDEGMVILPGSHEYSMRANWKLLIENSYDGYHGRATHQRYFEMLAASGKRMGQGVVKLGYELGSGHGITAGPAAELFRPMPTESAREKYQERRRRLEARHSPERVARMYGSRNMLIFPNLLIIDHVMGIVVRKVDPVAHDYTEITSWQLAPPEEDQELRELRLAGYLAFWGPGGLATPDDVEALECCQKGFRGATELAWSDISRGMVREHPLATDELQMRAFWRHWNYLVTGEQLPAERPMRTGPQVSEPVA